MFLTPDTKLGCLIHQRLGLGPEELMTVNDKLIYTRMTGWGQTGSLAPRAGHDINYIAQVWVCAIL